MKIFGKQFPIWGWFYVFFGVIFIMNGIMIYIANTSWTGLDTDNAYQKGLNYNKQLSQKEQQNASGWQAEITFKKTNNKQTGNLYVGISTAEGNPVENVSAIIKIQRPTNSEFDTEYAFETRSDGIFDWPISFPLEGQWDIKVEVMKEEQIFKAEKRLVI